MLQEYFFRFRSALRCYIKELAAAIVLFAMAFKLKDNNVEKEMRRCKILLFIIRLN
jgi:hypothetical protein